MKKISFNIRLLGFLCLTLFLSSCIKERDGSTSFEGSQPLAEILLSGKAYLAKANILVDPSDPTPIEREIAVNLASLEPFKEDVTVTIDVLDAERIAFNSTIANPSAKFEAMTSQQFSIPEKTAVIKAGERIAKFKVLFYPDKIDPTKSLMLPVGIKSTSKNILVSKNNGLVYFHVIGNPLAASYVWAYKRWNNASGTGSPTTSFTDVATFIPISPTTIEVQSGYGDQNGLSIRYQLSFTNTNGVLSDFKVKINPEDVDHNIINGGIGALSFTDATIMIADPATKHFKFTYAVVNSAGAPRYFIDEFTQ